MVLVTLPHAASEKTIIASKLPSAQLDRRFFLRPPTNVIPNSMGIHAAAYRNLPNCAGLDGTTMAVAAGTAIVSVEVTALAPGVTDVGEKAHVGVGAGPLTL